MTPTTLFGCCIAHAIAGEATTIRVGLPEMDVSVYNTVPRSSYGCYRGAELLLKTHVRIARLCVSPSPTVKSLLKQRLRNSNRVGAVVSLPG